MVGAVDILNKLFGSPYRVKILRFFLSNPEGYYSSKELAQRVNLNNDILRREVLILSKIGFIRSVKREKVEKWFLSHSFLFLKPLKTLILSVSPVSKEDLLEKLKKIGKCKIVILSGSLIQEDNDSKIDLLVVGDNLSRGMLTKLLKNVESEAGKELSYVLMAVKEFRYRIDIRDKFVREILESPHQVILDKLKIF